METRRTEVHKMIKKLADEIYEICHPEKIYLVSSKTDMNGNLTSFKLCIVVKDVLSTGELESKIYLSTDCELPFDLIFYTLSEWEELVDDYATFAYRISTSGVSIYG